MSETAIRREHSAVHSPAEVLSVRTLLLSCDIQSIETLCLLAQDMAIHIETCCDKELAMRKLCHSKFEGVIVDLAFPGGLEFLRTLRSLTSNKSAVSYAILRQSREQADAFEAGANFVFDRPLSSGSAVRVFKASYALMVRERRRYFRCPLEVAVSARRADGSEFTVSSLNISESGICVSSTQTVQAGDKLQLRLRLPNQSDLLAFSGDVCWSQATGRVGIQFYDVAPSVAQGLRSWLAERLEDSLLRGTDSETFRREIAGSGNA